MYGLAAASAIQRQLGADINRIWLRDAERTVDRAGIGFPELDDFGGMEISVRSALSLAATQLEKPFPIGFPRTEFNCTGIVDMVSRWIA